MFIPPFDCSEDHASENIDVRRQYNIAIQKVYHDLHKKTIDVSSKKN